MSQPSNNQNSAAKPGRRRLIIPIGLVLAAGFLYVIYWLIAVRGTAYTDDAQVKALLAPCSSRVGGRVVEILVREGEKVRKGQVLIRLDEMPYKAQLDEAQAAQAAAVAQVESAGLNLKRARAAWPKEIAMAEAELRAASSRESLAGKEKGRFDAVSSWVSNEAVDQAHTAWDGADALLTVAQQKLAMVKKPETEEGDTTPPPRELEIMVLENQLATAQANLGAAQARLSLARDNFDEVAVKALADGVVSRRHVEPGQVVSPGQKLLTITALTPIWVEANFEESDIADIKPGDEATIKIDAYPGRVFTGHVENTLPATLSQFSLIPAGATSGNFIKVTQRVPVRLAFDGKDVPFLYPGLNVEVRVRFHTAPKNPAASRPAR